MSGFTKLFSTIVHSTIWREDMHVKVVWVTMLALADRLGRVLVSVPGLADVSRVSLDQCLEALEKLSSPDIWSRSKEHGGRRIEPCEGGWMLLNYQKYRELRDSDEERIKTRERVRKLRAGRKTRTVTLGNGDERTVAPGTPIAEAEAEAEGRESPKKETLARSDADIAPGRQYPIVGKGASEPWVLPDGKVEEWTEAYPGVDVPATLRRARQWLIDNPTKRKTSGGMIRFLNSWLAGDQNRRGGLFQDRQPPKPRPGQPVNTDARRPILEDEP